MYLFRFLLAVQLFNHVWTFLVRLVVFAVVSKKYLALSNKWKAKLHRNVFSSFLADPKNKQIRNSKTIIWSEPWDLWSVEPLINTALSSMDVSGCSLTVYCCKGILNFFLLLSKELERTLPRVYQGFESRSVYVQYVTYARARAWAAAVHFSEFYIQSF